MIEQSFSLYSNNTAIIDSNGRLSYSHLGHAVKNLAQRLRDAGICQNDLIAIESRGRDLILLTLAVMQSGACAAAVPDQLAEHEKRSPMDKCFITAVISSGNSCLSEPLSGDITAPDLTGRYFITRITQKLPPALLKSRLLKNAAILRFTSGTTGDSKGVLFTRRSITERVAAANKALGINEQDIVLWVLPMAYHFIVSILLYLSAGACIILPDNNSPEALKKALKKYEVSVLYSTEHLFRVLLVNCAKADLHGIRKAFSTSSRLGPEISGDFNYKFGIPIRQAYGIIEAGLPFVNNADPVNKPESVGKISVDYKIKILDARGKRMTKCEIGNIFIKGPGMFDAYISPFKTRNKICNNGWFDTGDVGMIDQSGFLFLCGRSKNIINCMGMKIFPTEIEDVLNSHPLIRESLVTAKPHPYLNEVPHASIVLHEGNRKLEDNALTGFCSQHLSAYKIPRSFEYVDALPRTRSGKLKRK